MEMYMIVGIFLAIVLVLLHLLRTYLSGAKCLLRQRLDGKVIVVTGCNTGIGLETVAELARRGARVIMACRDLRKAEKSRAEILERYGVNNNQSTKLNLASENLESSIKPVTKEQLICESLDLASVPSIKNFAERLLQNETAIHMLINNAGVMVSDFQLTEYGFEKNMGVNHLGHFLLTHLLLPRLCSASGAKVINVSSDSHYFSRINIRDLNKPLRGSYYAHSKLAMVIHARELSRRYADQGLVAVSLHPGLTSTELFRQPTILNYLIRTIVFPFIKTPWDGAQTTLLCALSPKLIPGGYYRNCAPCQPNKQALDDTVCECVWGVSEKLVVDS
ncbi:Retinol dehydrogenase 12 [Fasciola hepatica]|uniref:Retinol dehydrogenase 12 n=1 Tax=Fasciola hepatica TaxID=6192 RepID=A0A2H1BXJ6_FASHE|nr:Retinol dehydrogenase 12 [Fasciola hepatica]